MAIAAALLAWLAASTLMVRLEYYDGLDSILNARYFTGQISAYTATRGPLLGLLLTPAEWIRQAFLLHPLEFRPHHAVMAVVHALFLFFSYALLRDRFGRTPATLFAFIAAVPTFIVFSYLPFISHDLFPGVLLLAMIIMTQRYLDTPHATLWLALAALGAAAAATKHIFGLFWIAILIAALPCLRNHDQRTRYAGLLAAAALSALTTWLIMCASLADVFPDAPWWARALEQLRYLSGTAHDQSRPEPWWIYARNAPAFGLTATLLIAPGLWYSLKGTPDQRLAARTWLILIIAMHLVPLRQVRYLAFLGPLTAYITQPVWSHLWLRKRWLVPAAALLAIEFLPGHAYSRGSEAARIFLPFYQTDVIRTFLRPAESSPGTVRTPVYLNTHMLSFAPDRTPPFPGDMYHDLFHVGYHHLFHLYSLKPGDIVMISNDEVDRFDYANRSGTMIYASTGILIHRTGWRNRGTDHRDELVQMVVPLPLVAHSP